MHRCYHWCCHWCLIRFGRLASTIPQMRHRNIFDVVAILVAIATIACSGNAHESRADPPSSSTRAPVATVDSASPLDHPIADLDGDGIADTVHILDPNGAPRVGLRLSGGS